MNALELAELHIDALYQRDTDGFIVASRDPAVTPPLFHLVRTPLGNRWILGAGLEPTPRERVASILSMQPLIPDCAAAPSHPPDIEAIRAALAEQAAPVREYRGPALSFPDELPSLDGAELLSDLRRAPRDGPFAWLRNVAAAERPIAIVRADDRELASVCYSARSTPAAAEAGVETIDRYRGRGYGSMAVVAWAAAVRRGGREPPRPPLLRRGPAYRLIATARAADHTNAPLDVRHRQGPIRFERDVQWPRWRPLPRRAA